MSILKTNTVQIGQSSTATNNFTMAVPTVPDGTVKLSRGNPGATTADILSIDASGNIATSGNIVATGAITSGGVAAQKMVLATTQNTTSGTYVDFTGIPSWVKKITVIFKGVSMSGTDHVLIQLGTSSGLQNTGYNGASNVVLGGVTSSSANSTSGMILNVGAPNNVVSGALTLTMLGSNNWIGTHVFNHDTAVGYTGYGASSATLSGTLDRVRFTLTTTNTFDSGSVNILYEGY
jgi:hypothetical protein